jgi:hypothetical protein
MSLVGPRSAESSQVKEAEAGDFESKSSMEADDEMGRCSRPTPDRTFQTEA